jgi:hypothetical protein
MKLILVLICIFYPAFAFAYIDPGTGSLWLQYLMGGMTSLYFIIKIYYTKIKTKYFSKKINSVKNISDENGDEVKDVK